LAAQNKEILSVKFLQMGMLLSVSLVLLCSPVVVFSEDKYGVGGDDYIVEDGAPDLLGDDGNWEDEAASLGIYDPLDPMNRVFFEFNDKLYFWVLKPVRQGYTAVVPEDIRVSVGNFFYNLAAPVNIVNTLLQGRFEDSGVVLSRFVINSTLGVFGFGDVAAEEFDLKPESGDFGETLGVYGIGEGIYLCWPVFGPSNIRDSVGIFGDMQLHPYNYAEFDTKAEAYSRGAEFVNRLSITPAVYEEIKKISIDPYVATRQAYIDYRRNLIVSHE